jgi:hypothetical protein
MKAAAVFVGSTIVLAACSQAIDYTYSKRNFSSSTFEADLSACRHQRPSVSSYETLSQEKNAQLDGSSAAGLILVIQEGECLPIVIADNEARLRLFDRPRRREATLGHHRSNEETDGAPLAPEQEFGCAIRLRRAWNEREVPERLRLRPDE